MSDVNKDTNPDWAACWLCLKRLFRLRELRCRIPALCGPCVWSGRGQQLESLPTSRPTPGGGGWTPSPPQHGPRQSACQVGPAQPRSFRSPATNTFHSLSLALLCPSPFPNIVTVSRPLTAIAQKGYSEGKKPPSPRPLFAIVVSCFSRAWSTTAS